MSATPAGDNTGTASSDVQRILDTVDLPSGASYTMGGVTSDQSVTDNSLGIATIFALLPMALGITRVGGFISQPLAVVVIEGLVVFTVLTLVLIPTLYTMVETPGAAAGPREPWDGARSPRRSSPTRDGSLPMTAEPTPDRTRGGLRPFRAAS